MIPARFRPLLSCAAFYLGGGFLLRVALFILFCRPEAPWGLFAPVCARGALLDAAAGALVLLPFALYLAAVPRRFFPHRAHRILLAGGLLVWSAAQAFSFACEYYFFEEFNSRFNHIALDYLLFPYEVFVNIWQSYPVLPAAGLSLAAGAGAVLLGRRLFGRPWEPVSWRARSRFAALYALSAAGLCLAAAGALRASQGADRVVRQVSSNGLLELARAAYTHRLDFGAYYRSLPREEAFSRSRALLGAGGEGAGSSESITRFVSGSPGARPRNVVLILIESFGSEFSGVFGGAEPSWTPRFDAWAGEGLAFTRVYATGNRTVRGLEGVLAGFPPLPGDAIVKRDKSKGLNTLAAVLKERGYETLFLYGGRGVFDGLRSFALDNGFERFIEQKDFASPRFATAWGVCDEDLYDRTLEEIRLLARRGRPFFAAALTVSNHKPYTYPSGRIPEDPAARNRAHAVKYADWALGRFLEEAKKEPFYKDTLFAVVADHGARVYGHQTLPIRSYEIPLLVLAPGRRPARIGTLGSSLDVAPTLLGLLGRPYLNSFFGQDLLAAAPGQGRALMQHNRDIGMLRGDRLAVLGLGKSVEFYRVAPGRGSLELKASADAPDQELARDAQALFSVADELYESGRYRPPAAAPVHASGKKVYGGRSPQISGG